MYAGRDFDPSDPGESEMYGFDFVNDLPPNDSITAVAITMAVDTGSDPDPSARLDGLPGIDGTQVFQRVVNTLAGNIYLFRAVVTTRLGSVISLYSHIPAQSVY